MKNAMIILVASLVVLVAVAVVSSPYVVSKGLEMGLHKTLGAEVTVQLGSYPSLRLLLGQFDSLSVVAQNVPLGGIRASQYRVAAEGVHVNLRKLLLRQELELIEQGDITVTIDIPEAELSRYVWEQIPELKDWRILINEDHVVVVGQAPLLSALVDVRITGVFSAFDTDKIAFIPASVEVQGLTLPAEMVNQAFKDVDFHIDMTAAPLPLELTDVEQRPGLLIIRARVIED
jgi:hypothetical protein